VVATHLFYLNAQYLYSSYYFVSSCAFRVAKIVISLFYSGLQHIYLFKIRNPKARGFMNSITHFESITICSQSLCYTKTLGAIGFGP
jgi:hypothetical protein